MYSKQGKKPRETTLGAILMADILKFIYNNIIIMYKNTILL